VPDMENYSWFHGNITRGEAVHRLDCGIAGSYLVRESESVPGKYSISLHVGDRITHYLISKDSSTSKWFCGTQTLQHDTIPDLVVHYSKSAHGFPTEFRYPVSNPLKPSTNIQHEVNEWEINRPAISMSRKLYEGTFETYKAFIKSKGMSVFIRPFRAVRF
jgi:hypothetical protein